MDSTILVAGGLSRERRDNGWELLDWLIKSGFEISAMYWHFDTDWMAWRLVIATPLVDSEGPLAVYDKIMPFIQDRFNDVDGLFTDQVSLISPRMNSIKDILRKYGEIPPDKRMIRRLNEDEPYTYCLKKPVENVAVAA